MGRATAKFFLALPPGALGRGQKVKYHLISITKSMSKIFIPNFVCVLTNERYKTYQTGFSFCRLSHAPGVGLRAMGVTRGSKVFFFFKHGHVAYQIDGDDQPNRMQVKFSTYGQTGDLGVRSKSQISLNFSYHVNFKDFYTKLCVCSHK